MLNVCIDTQLRFVLNIFIEQSFPISKQMYKAINPLFPWDSQVGQLESRSDHLQPQNLCIYLRVLNKSYPRL